MKLHPIFFEPEVHSTSFLSANIIGSIFIYFVLHSWPLSIFWSGFYIILVFLINHALAAGHYYLPTKNLRGQTVIVTGAATGIARVCALRFAKLGASVIIGVRGQERAERIAQELCKESNGGTVIGYDLDLSSLANVKLFAEKIDRVDILLNNAGAVQEIFSVTTDGIEKQFGTNHS
jgi:NADPH:quinone reductase-like Zn-dependent oxidoreductase